MIPKHHHHPKQGTTSLPRGAGSADRPRVGTRVTSVGTSMPKGTWMDGHWIGKIPHSVGIETYPAKNTWKTYNIGIQVLLFFEGNESGCLFSSWWRLTARAVIQGSGFIGQFTSYCWSFRNQAVAPIEDSLAPWAVSYITRKTDRIEGFFLGGYRKISSLNTFPPLLQFERP